jgi:DTW domain-containing protein YfiP
MSAGAPKVPARRLRQPRGSGIKQIDVEALRASVGPRLHASRERGLDAFETDDGTRVERQFCYRCHKASVVCLCDRIREVANRTEILIFQHPRERFHALGTARIAHLGLERCEILVASGQWGGIDRPYDPPASTGLLYPGESSIALEEADPSELPDHLVVLDGTWAHAHKLYDNNAWLRALPHYGLSPSEPSRYRIRAEPKANCLSTVESIVAALQIIEPETPGLAELVGVFDSMIDDQIRYMV